MGTARPDRHASRSRRHCAGHGGSARHGAGHGGTGHCRDSRGGRRACAGQPPRRVTWIRVPGRQDDPPGQAAFHQRADGQAELVEQIRCHQLPEQRRAALDEDKAMPGSRQRCDHRRRRCRLRASDDHLGGPGCRRAPVSRRGLGRDHDRRGQASPGRQQRPVEIKIKSPGRDRDRRGGRPTLAQLRPRLAGANLSVMFGTCGACAHQDHVGHAPQHREDKLVGGPGQPARPPAQRASAISA